MIRISPSPCPYCSLVLNAATGVEVERPPQPEDLTLCKGCGAILVFDENLRHRKPTKEEIDSITPEENAGIQKAQILIQQGRFS